MFTWGEKCMFSLDGGCDIYIHLNIHFQIVTNEINVHFFVIREEEIV